MSTPLRPELTTDHEPTNAQITGAEREPKKSGKTPVPEYLQIREEENGTPRAFHRQLVRLAYIKLVKGQDHPRQVLLEMTRWMRHPLLASDEMEAELENLYLQFGNGLKLGLAKNAKKSVTANTADATDAVDEEPETEAAVSQKIITLIGKPGAGKGTQGKALYEQTGFPHISTGDMLRARALIPDELGAKCKQIVDNGTYADDALMVEMIRERAAQPDCANGFILDGFPRTLPQVTAFEQMLSENGKSITHAIVLEVGDATALMRMEGRRMCKKCGAIYHIPLNPPHNMGICDGHDEEPVKLTTRPDDADPQKRKSRLALHHNETNPVIGHYKEQKGIVVVIDGEGDSPSIVYERIMQKTSLAKVRKVAHQP